MKRRGTGGSALVVTMLLLVILTALGIYTVGMVVSGIETASLGQADKAAMNAAEAGVYYGVDRLPFPADSLARRLPNGATYEVNAAPVGIEAVPGCDTGFVQAVYRIRSTGRAASGAGEGRTIEARAVFGPVPSGTGYGP